MDSYFVLDAHDVCDVV